MHLSALGIIRSKVLRKTIRQHALI